MKMISKELGIVSADDDGIFHMADGRVMKAVHIDFKESFREQLLKIPCSVRLTSFFTEKGWESYLTLTAGQYEEEVIKDALALIKKSGVCVQELSGDEVFARIRENYQMTDLDIPVRSGGREMKKKELIKKPEYLSDTDFNIGEIFGSAYFALHFDEGFSFPLDMLRDAGLSFVTAVDIAPLSDKSAVNYKKLLETHYDRQVAFSSDDGYINVSLYLMTKAESEEARTTFSDIIINLFKPSGIILAPAFGQQQRIEESLLSFGLMPSSYMRIIGRDEAEDLII